MSEQCQRHHEPYARDFCLTHDSFYVYDGDDLCTHARAVTAEATIKRVRELCERQSFRATAEGYCVVMRVVETREVLRVLDGEQ